MGTVASQITSLTMIYSIVCSGADHKKTAKLGVTGLIAGNSPVAVEFPTERASNVDFFSIWWRYHEYQKRSKKSDVPEMGRAHQETIRPTCWHGSTPLWQWYSKYVSLFNTRKHLYDIHGIIHLFTTLSPLLALCGGNPPVTCGSPYREPIMPSMKFSLLSAWTSRWTNSSFAVDLRRHDEVPWRLVAPVKLDVFTFVL